MPSRKMKRRARRFADVEVGVRISFIRMGLCAIAAQRPLEAKKSIKYIEMYVSAVLRGVDARVEEAFRHKIFAANAERARKINKR